MLDEIKDNKEQIDELEVKDEASRTEKDNEALKDMHQKENNYIKAFESKVIMYLFEDVMKMRPENIFIGHHKKNGNRRRNQRKSNRFTAIFLRQIQ